MPTYLGTDADNRLEGSFEDDTIFAYGGRDRLFGLEGSDLLYGGSGSDLLYGGDDNDRLYGGTANDDFYAGPGVDSVYGGSGDDRVFFFRPPEPGPFPPPEPSGPHTLGSFYDGGDGIDTIYTGAATGGAAYVWDLEAGEYRMGDLVIERWVNFENFEEPYRSTNETRNIYGSSADNHISTGRGDDTLRGLAGDDILESRSGHNLLEGGDGNDTLYGGRSDYGGASNDVLYGGTGADSLTGWSGENQLFGDAGDDRIESWGDDTAFGGSGDDRFLAFQESLAAYGGEGDDRYYSGVSDGTFYGDAGNDIATTNGSVRAIAFGGDGDDTLKGDRNIDDLYGGQGNDLIDGGQGADRIFAGGGDDQVVYTFDSAMVSVTGGAGEDTILATEIGFNSTSSFDLADGFYYGSGGFTEVWSGFEHYQGGTGPSFESVFGTDTRNVISTGGGTNIIEGRGGDDDLFAGAGNDIARGGDGDDLLDGGAGDDRMFGGLGNDIYVVDTVGDQVLGEIGFASGGGIDIVESFVTYTLPSNIEVLYLQGSANITGKGNAAPEALVGQNGANFLRGNGGNDLLNGKGNNDVLVGGTGQDSLVGGTGADRFDYNAIADSYAGAATRDFINGFSNGFDTIDVSGIDANPYRAGDQAFEYLGTAPFDAEGANSAGQLRWFTFGGGNFNIVEADWNGDGTAEMQIFVNLTNVMTEEDFIL